MIPFKGTWKMNSQAFIFGGYYFERLKINQHDFPYKRFANKATKGTAYSENKRVEQLTCVACEKL